MNDDPQRRPLLLAWRVRREGAALVD